MIYIRLMTFDDMEFGLRLRQQAGWNQTPADWARCLRLQPEGCFVAEQDGTPCGTLTTCILGEVAWLGMMLVEQERRGQGIARALMQHALAFLEGRGIRTVRLDATPLGEPLYRSLDFVEQFSLGRFAGIPMCGEKQAGVELAGREQWEAICRLDQAVTATDRRRGLLDLLQERAEEVRIVRRGGAVIGYLSARRGMRAWQIGPCIATSEAGPPLLEDALSRFANREVFVDVPLSHSPAVDLLARRGLRQQRKLLRMCRGEAVSERVQQLWASSGPVKG
jgi:GNAT superfamily N-acetyltransferase